MVQPNQQLKNLFEIENKIIDLLISNRILTDGFKEMEKLAKDFNGAMDAYKSGGGKKNVYDVLIFMLNEKEIEQLHTTLKSAPKSAMQSMKLYFELNTVLLEHKRMEKAEKEYKVGLDSEDHRRSSLQIPSEEKKSRFAKLKQITNWNLFKSSENKHEQEPKKTPSSPKPKR